MTKNDCHDDDDDDDDEQNTEHVDLLNKILSQTVIKGNMPCPSHQVIFQHSCAFSLQPYLFTIVFPRVRLTADHLSLPGVLFDSCAGQSERVIRVVMRCVPDSRW